MEFISEKSIAFQGEYGAFSEAAAFDLFGENAKVQPSASFRDVFDRVNNGECEYGVVPVENTLGGAVYQIPDLLTEYKPTIVGEIKLKIEQCLISNKGATLSEIEKIYTHYQPARQCKNFLEKHAWVIEDANDTAGSVKIIKEKGDRRLAAIASERAAELYDMQILQKGIQDSSENYTRFIAFTKALS